MSDQQEQPVSSQAEAARASESPRRALLLDSDLFFSVKVTDTLKHAGYQTRTVRQIAAFTQALADDRPVLVLVNTAARGIDWRAGIVAAREAGIPVVAFGSHVDLATQEEARQAGATSVIANSKLASDLPGVVARALRRGTATNPDDVLASDETS
ncbi:MAG: hypothetical protein ACXVCO_13035 [Ktedonobacterales bacterium]